MDASRSRFSVPLCTCFAAVTRKFPTVSYFLNSKVGFVEKEMR
jgi:hypothetical protein